MPISTPEVRTKTSGECEFAIATRPSTYSAMPPSTTRAVPYLSAIIPANGCVAPHTRFCTAIASANVSRPQPMSCEIGCRKRPKPWRMPMAMVRMIPPQTRTTVGVRQSAAAR